MSDEVYFEISNGDGDLRITVLTREQLEKRIAEHARDCDKPPNYLSSVGSPDRWDDGEMLLIKGRIVRPRPIETVVKYEVP